MMILAGDKKIKMFTGATKVKAAYMGAVKVYPNSSLAVTASLAFAAAGGSQTLSIQVEDGQPWNLYSLPAGWTASATSGTGPASVTITASNNTTTAGKGYSIDIISEDLAASCSVSQAAGAIHYGTPIVTAFGYPDIPAAGGTVTPNVLAYEQVYTWNGVPGSGGVLTTGGTVYYSNTTGVVSAGNLGTEVRGRTAVAMMTTRVDMNGVTGQNATCNIWQAANVLTYGSQYFSISPSSASIGSAAGSVLVSVQSRQDVSYTSGGTGYVNTSREPGVNISGSGFSYSKITPAGIYQTYEYRVNISANTSTGSRSGYIQFVLSDIPTVTVNISQSGIPWHRLYIGGSSGGGVPFDQWAVNSGNIYVQYGASRNGPWMGGSSYSMTSVGREDGVQVYWAGDYPYARITGNPLGTVAIMAAINLSVISGGMASMGEMDAVVMIGTGSPEGGVLIEPRPR